MRQLTPATLIMGRIGLAALTLALVVPVLVGGRETLRQMRENAGWLVVVALVNTAVPFWLLSWGETRIDSGLASIIQAAVPIFNALIAFGFFHEVRVTGVRLAGIAIGFVGVALLVGRHLSRVRPPVVALATTAVSALVALPAGIAQAPHHLPGWKAIGSVLALGVPGTALAYLLFFGLIAGAGAAYTSLVTYLIPPIALGYGAIFLGEGIGAVALGGLALVLGGVALGTGALNPARLRRGVVSEV